MYTSPISGIIYFRVMIMKRNTKIFILAILLAEAVGGLSGFLTRDGMRVFTEALAKPPLSPPPLLFPIVWGILYSLMGLGSARVWLTPQSPERSRALNLYTAQLIVNFFWSLIFFNAQAFGFAFFWLLLLWLLVLLMILAFREVDPLSAWLQVPYLLWLTFAACLNLGVWYLNT